MFFVTVERSNPRHLIVGQFKIEDVVVLGDMGRTAAAMAQQGIEMKYDTLHKVLGKGNFVLTVSEGYLGGVHSSYFDLFRIENGKIAEHWDTIESILPEDKRLNANGKFGF